MVKGNNKPLKKLFRRKIARRLKSEARSLRGIQQSVGSVTRSSFPKVRKRTKRTDQSRRMMLKQGLNAMLPAHIALPRAVGAYSVIRTTQVISSLEPCALFGCFKGPRNNFTETTWFDICAVTNAPNKQSVPIDDNSGAAFFYNMTPLTNPAYQGSKMVPAAITVQIMNPNALQTTSGIVYIGRSKVVLDLMGNTRTWEDLLTELISYSAPRLCSAGKLALRGVQVNAIPYNMSVLSDFVPRGLALGGPAVWKETNSDPNQVYPADFEGFGPIFVYNPQKVELQYLVTIEWRTRFDPGNPAYAGHVMHKPATESIWSQVISDSESLGHGVEDIADIGIDAAMAAFGAAASAA